MRHTETIKETHRDREATQHTALTQRSGAGQVLLVGQDDDGHVSEKRGGGHFSERCVPVVVVVVVSGGLVG